MKSFETVYKELEYLFIEKLPEYIEKVNKEHNDGIILTPFYNKTLDEDCLKIPNFRFGLNESEYTEKDRIIENTVYNFNLEVHTGLQTSKKVFYLCRYVEAIELMIDEVELNEELLEIKNLKVSNDIISFRSVL